MRYWKEPRSLLKMTIRPLIPFYNYTLDVTAAIASTWTPFLIKHKPVLYCMICAVIGPIICICYGELLITFKSNLILHT